VHTRGRRAAVVVATTAFTTVALIGCGGGDGRDTAGDTPTTSGPPTSVSVPHGLGPPPTDVDGSVPPTVLLPQSALGPWSLDLETSDGFPVTDGPAVPLVAVRNSVEGGAQRIVFEFDGDDVPSWQVGYEPLPVSADPDGEPIAVTGTVALVVRLTPATAADPVDGPTTGDDDRRRLGVDGNGPLREVVLAGDVGGLLTWALGVDTRVPFAVDALRSPARLVIDVLRTGD